MSAPMAPPPALAASTLQPPPLPPLTPLTPLHMLGNGSAGSGDYLAGTTLHQVRILGSILSTG